MKKIIFSVLFVVAVFSVSSQNVASRLMEYQPAPGQHINREFIGTPAAAERMTENLTSTVSLGSFGGYLVLGFEEGCVNHPDNPYGIDFSIFGNAFAGSSEPGVVWVMKDENRNGIPDDTWYEIAGSSHYHSATRQGYRVTYHKTETRDVFWTDNLGDSGWIKANQFNLQDYYPIQSLFPGYPSDSVSFSGTLLAAVIDFSNPTDIKVMPPVFGYADCHPRQQGINTDLPDNPYTWEVEGAGGDPVDISWAIDQQGRYIDLDTIHFVKIVSSNLVSAGWLGELSTEVAWVEAVTPQPGVTGKEHLLVLFPFVTKLLAGDSLRLEACYFERGRKRDAVVSFTTSDDAVLSVDNEGWVRALSPGTGRVTVSANGEHEQVSIRVVVPESIQMISDLSGVYPGDTILLDSRVLDGESEQLDVPIQYTSSNSFVGEVISVNGRSYFVGRVPGTIILTSAVDGFPLGKQIEVHVLSPDDDVRIYFTLKGDMENLLPWQWIEVNALAAGSGVASAGEGQSGGDGATLFQVLAAGLEQAGLTYQFRDDEAAGGKTYLYSVEVDGLFFYGWGGKTDPEPFGRAWIARLNSRQYLNGFNALQVSDGDTVALYHAPDILQAWSYDRLLAGSDSISLHDEVELNMEQTQCVWSNGEVIEAGFTPVVNAEIVAGRSYFTNAFGSVTMRVESDPPLVVSSGSNAVLLASRVVTGITRPLQQFFYLYPNPVTTELVIKGIGDLAAQGYSGSADSSFSETHLKVINITGQVVLSQLLSSVFEKVDFSFLPKGIYQVMIQTNGSIEIHSVVKQ